MGWKDSRLADPNRQPAVRTVSTSRTHCTHPTVFTPAKTAYSPGRKARGVRREADSTKVKHLARRLPPYGARSASAGGFQGDVVSPVIDGVHETVLPGVLGFEDEVPVGVLGDLLHRLPRVEGHDLVDPLLQPHEVPPVDLNVRRLPLDPKGQRLVDQEPGVWHRVALPTRAGRHEH